MAGTGGGTITVSAAQLGQVALQIQQQVWPVSTQYTMFTTVIPRAAPSLFHR